MAKESIETGRAVGLENERDAIHRNRVPRQALPSSGGLVAPLDHEQPADNFTAIGARERQDDGTVCD